MLLQGNLLDDKQLIDVLAVTKATSAEVTERLKGASETEIKIKDACEEFRPVAHRATLLYFLIAEFSTVNCMYQTSLAQVRLPKSQMLHDVACLASYKFHAMSLMLQSGSLHS